MLYFDIDEFKCRCCGKVALYGELVVFLQAFRKLLGSAIIVSSGYRCKKHNTEVGGKPNSSHLFGYAADIVPKVKQSMRDLTSIVLSGWVFCRVNNIGVGLGLSDDFLHFDVHPIHQRLWTYNKYGITLPRYVSPSSFEQVLKESIKDVEKAKYTEQLKWLGVLEKWR